MDDWEDEPVETRRYVIDCETQQRTEVCNMVVNRWYLWYNADGTPMYDGRRTRCKEPPARAWDGVGWSVYIAVDYAA